MQRPPLAAALAIVFVGAAVRLVALDLAHPVRLVGDEKYYVNVAANIAEGRGHVFERDGVLHRAFRPPGHSWLLSLALSPDSAAAARDGAFAPRSMLLQQSVLGTLLVAAVIALGRAVFGWREGLLAGLVAAIDPTLVAHSHYLWSETLSTALLAGALALAVAAERKASAAAAAAAGLAFGLAALTREVALPIAAACAAWGVATSAPPRARAAGRGALVLALAAAVVVPWTLRNWREIHRFIPVATTGVVAAREGNTFSKRDWLRTETAELKAFHHEYFAIPDEGERLDFARRQTEALILAEQPLWLAKKVARTVVGLWSPDSYLFVKLGRGAYGPLAPATVRALLLLTIAVYAAVVVGAILGAAGAPDRSRRLLPALVVGVVCAAHVLANSAARFRVPLMPLLFVYAAHAALHPREISGRLRGRARVAAAALLLVFLGGAIPPFLGDAASLWMRGTYREGGFAGIEGGIPGPRSRATSGAPPPGED